MPPSERGFDPSSFFLGGVAVFEDGRRLGAVGVSGLPARMTSGSRWPR